MTHDGRPTFALVTRAFWPFLTGGGIARYSRAVATLLEDSADVTVILPDFYAGSVPLDDPRVPQGVRFEFVPEPNRGDPRPFSSLYHAWSAAAYEALCRLYPEGGPDLVEFGEFTGEGAVSVQAKQSGSPTLARTRILLGVHGTDEIHRVLNGQSLTEPESAALTALERIGLAGADVIFTPGGDVHGTYERYYGADALAPARVVTHPFLSREGEAQPPRGDGGPLQLVHAGRYERRKGVAELISAVRSLRRDDLRLSLMGSDTPTGPGGTSMLEYCRQLAGDDERIEFRDKTDFAGVLRCFAEHDVVVIPSRWETNANTAREALMVARPVLTTPTGGLVRIIENGVNGWLTTGTAPSHLAEAIERLLDDRAEVDRLVGSPALRESLDRCVQNDEAHAEYLAELNHPPAPRAAEPVQVGVCVVGPAGSELEPTLESIRRQSSAPAGDVVVAAGSHPGELELPPGEAVTFVPAGAVLSPAFLEVCGRALGARADAAYVTTWTDAAEPWLARPLGNSVPLVDAEDCGGAVLVVRAAHAAHAASRIGAPELAGGGAWLIARELRAEGEYGAVVPEELARVRDLAGWLDTSSRRTEVEAALRRERTRWPALAAA
jgi:glycosyltransferase involved in cell wall biosynthesis